MQLLRSSGWFLWRWRVVAYWLKILVSRYGTSPLFYVSLLRVCLFYHPLGENHNPVSSSVILQAFAVTLSLRLRLWLHIHHLHLSQSSPWFCPDPVPRIHHGSSLQQLLRGPSTCHGFGHPPASPVSPWLLPPSPQPWFLWSSYHWCLPLPAPALPSLPSQYGLTFSLCSVRTSFPGRGCNVLFNFSLSFHHICHWLSSSSSFFAISLSLMLCNVMWLLFIIKDNSCLIFGLSAQPSHDSCSQREWTMEINPFIVRQAR